MEYSISDGSSGSISIKEDGSWKVLLDFTEIEDTMTVTTVVTCGKFTQLSDTTGTLVMLEGGGADADGDGIQDTTDRCPNGIGEAEGWKSNQNTDKDDDGCRDVDEDDDDDAVVTRLFVVTNFSSRVLPKTVSVFVCILVIFFETARREKQQQQLRLLV